MFLAALTSRSCDAPQRTHTQALTPSVLSPLGPERVPQSEQVTLENVSRPDTQVPASLLALYDNWNLTLCQAASSVDFAKGVLMSLLLDTSPMTISFALRAIAVVALCVQSARVLAIVAWIAFTRRFLCARWAIARASS